MLNIFALRTKQNKLAYDVKTVGELITLFLKQYGDKLDESILSKNKKKLNPQMVVLLNGRDVSYLKNYKTKLNEGDKVYLSYPISGG